MTTTEKRSHADMILDAARELQAAGLLVTRESLSELTSLKLAVIDDRIKYLLDLGLINRRQRGVFEPAEIYPPARQIWYAKIGHKYRLEIGDDHIIHLTPEEARSVGCMMAGQFMAFQVQELAYQAVERNNDLSRQVGKLTKKMAAKEGVD